MCHNVDQINAALALNRIPYKSIALSWVVIRQIYTSYPISFRYEAC